MEATESHTPDAIPAAATITPDPGPPAAPDLVERVGTLERELREAQRAARQAQVRVSIHRSLAGSGAIDAEAVALVVEAALGETAADADDARVARTLDEVRRTRPSLFRTTLPPGGRSSAMTVRVERQAPRSPLEDAARDAQRTGDRASLLHYLRLRRAS